MCTRIQFYCHILRKYCTKQVIILYDFEGKWKHCDKLNFKCEKHVICRLFPMHRLAHHHASGRMCFGLFKFSPPEKINDYQWLTVSVRARVGSLCESACSQKFLSAVKGKWQKITWTTASLELCQPQSIPRNNTHTNTLVHNSVSHSIQLLSHCYCLWPATLETWRKSSAEQTANNWLMDTNPILNLIKQRHHNKYLKTIILFL